MQKKFEHEWTNDKNVCKVKDHCQYTGKCRGAGYSTCNSKYSLPKEIPVVFHSQSNYD